MTTSLTIPDDDAETLADLREQLHPDTKKRWTFVQLSEWLKESKGIEASREAVRRAVKPIADERRAAAREALTAKLTEKLDAQVGDLDALMGAARALVLTPEGAPLANLDSELVLDTLDGYRKAVETKLKAVGAGKDEVDREAAEKIVDGLASFLGLAFSAGGGAPPTMGG